MSEVGASQPEPPGGSGHPPGWQVLSELEGDEVARRQPGGRSVELVERVEDETATIEHEFIKDVDGEENNVPRHELVVAKLEEPCSADEETMPRLGTSALRGCLHRGGAATTR